MFDTIKKTAVFGLIGVAIGALALTPLAGLLGIAIGVGGGLGLPVIGGIVGAFAGVATSAVNALTGENKTGENGEKARTPLFKKILLGAAIGLAVACLAPMLLGFCGAAVAIGPTTLGGVASGLAGLGLPLGGMAIGASLSGISGIFDRIGDALSGRKAHQPQLRQTERVQPSTAPREGRTRELEVDTVSNEIGSPTPTPGSPGYSRTTERTA